MRGKAAKIGIHPPSVRKKRGGKRKSPPGGGDTSPGRVTEKKETVRERKFLIQERDHNGRKVGVLTLKGS